MADPLSIATGIMTCWELCNALASTIKELHQLRKALKELEMLENEISSLQSYTGGINQLMDIHTGTSNVIIGQMSLGLNVDSARTKIQEIQKIFRGLFCMLCQASGFVRRRGSNGNRSSIACARNFAMCD